MNTAIGHVPRRSTLATGMWLLLLVHVFVDLFLVSKGLYQWRTALVICAVLSCAIFSYYVGLRPIGLSLTPRQGWRYWISATAILGVVGFSICLAAMVWLWLGYDLPNNFQPYLARSADFLPVFLCMCLYSPILEEVFYRACLCPPLVAFVGPLCSIIVSGLLFAGLHFLYGNPSPENVLGGLILAWAYLKSDTILVPLALHALGNLLVLLFHVTYLYLFG